jgi:hypothetical protein
MLHMHGSSKINQVLDGAGLQKALKLCCTMLPGPCRMSLLKWPHVQTISEDQQLQSPGQAAT